MARTKSKVGCLLVLLLLLGGGWLFRDTIAGWFDGVEFGSGSVPTERLAGAAQDKVERLVRNGLSRPARFSEAELQSLLTYRATPFLPAGVDDPRIDVQDSVIVLSAQVRPAELTEVAALDALRTMLSDSSRVTAVFVPSVDQPGRLTVQVLSLQIGEMFVPSFLLPMIIDGLASEGFQTSGGSVVAQLPAEVGSVRIEGDDVVIEPISNPD